MSVGIALLLLSSLLAAPRVVAAAGAWEASEYLDCLVEDAIRHDKIPGAVLVVSYKGRILHRKAYGSRALAPVPEKMTLDTIFDAASLTKVVATATAVMQLFEQGKIRLNDRVTQYLPEFQGGVSRITVRHLMTHFSGLRPDVDLAPAWSGYATGVAKAMVDKPVAEPGSTFIYSDINYILLGEIVRRVSGQSLADYARERIFRPLGMRNTMFLPPPAVRPRIAPTERLARQRNPLRGVVHDPTARNMGGIAGHAGMFTTAADLIRYSEMILSGGEYLGVRVLHPLTVRKMTTPQTPADQPVMRGLGWDIDSSFSSTRGELLPVGSYGHTGFTGTSLWIDPTTRTYVILLTNSVHPSVREPVTSLRSKVATAAAAALGIDLPGISITGYNETMAFASRAVARNAQALTGLDALAAGGFAELKGKRVGLITNHTGTTREGLRNIDAMVKAGVNLKALLSPEHGLAGAADVENIPHETDLATGIPVWSLYRGADRRPSAEMLKDIDLLVFDIQDIGARFYTYMCTMLNAMEEAARRGIPFMVLDRPNPITGVRVEGPMLDKDLESFVGCYPLPLRHGMTIGEIAKMANQERKIGVKLTVVAMKGWARGDWFDSTGLAWINPSPNMRSLNAALLYPGIAMMEYSLNYSVGRGTDAPFEQIGADWIDGPQLAAYLNARRIPGIRVYPTRFQPDASRFAGMPIGGVRFVVTDRNLLNSSRVGLEVAAAIEALYPGKIDWQANERLIGNRQTIKALRAGEEPTAVQAIDASRLEEFLAVRQKYLLYP
ncbi:MAG: DUF1343 domain-containing protein [Bryobacteraceae bacterium]|nr:DUF1343 domain-containing protein [Bryobacteraceae bacterium]